MIDAPFVTYFIWAISMRASKSNDGKNVSENLTEMNGETVFIELEMPCKFISIN